MVDEIGGVRQYVQTSYIDEKDGGVVCGFDAKDGKLLWTGAMVEGHSYAIAPTPIIRDNFVYVACGYGGGCHLFQLAAKGKTFAAKDLYSRPIQIKVDNAHGGMVMVGDHLFGHSKGPGWVCQDWQSGKLKWNNKNKLPVKSGAIVAAGDRLYLYSDSGVAVLHEAYATAC